MQNQNTFSATAITALIFICCSLLGMEVKAQSGAAAQPVKKIAPTTTQGSANTNPAPWEKQQIVHSNTQQASGKQTTAPNSNPADARPIQSK